MLGCLLFGPMGLAGMAAGMTAGHGLGGAESMFSTYLGGKIGAEAGPAAHSALASVLRQFPPSVVARALASLGYPISKEFAEQYDAMQGRRDSGQNPPQSQ